MNEFNVIKPNDEVVEKRKAQNAELRKIVGAWKIIAGFDGDKGWDTMYWARSSRTAKRLLGYLGSVERVVQCMHDTYEKIVEQKGFELSLEGVEKQAGNWKKDNLEREAKQ